MRTSATSPFQSNENPFMIRLPTLGGRASTLASKDQVCDVTR